MYTNRFRDGAKILLELVICCLSVEEEYVNFQDPIPFIYFHSMSKLFSGCCELFRIFIQKKADAAGLHGSQDQVVSKDGGLR